MNGDIEKKVLEHINDRPRRKAAEKIGVSLTAFYRIVRIHHGEIRYDLSTKREKWVYDYIRDHYANDETSVISKHVGLCESKVKEWAHNMGVYKSEEFHKNHIKKMLQASHQNEVYEKCHKKWKLTRRIDELRILGGGKQETDFKYRKMTHRAYKSSWYLIKRYGYIRDHDDWYVLYYSEGQRRSIYEKLYEEKYRIKFKKYEEKKLQ